MAYCVVEDVKSEFKSLPIDSNGILTTAKIEGFIAQADAYINGRLASLYTVPITGAESLLIIKQISIDLVAQRIAHIMEMKGITPKGDQFIPKDLGKKAEDRINMILKKTLVLSDAAQAIGSSGVASSDSCSETPHSFIAGKVQW